MAEEEKQTEEAVGGLFHDDSGSDVNQTADTSVTWTASEFISHEKNGGWYAALALAILVLTGLAYLLTRDVIPCTAVVVGGILFGVYAAREPRELEYGLDAGGLSVGPRRFSYEDFRSFSLMEEGPVRRVDLMPLKRFSPILTIYFHPDDEPVITDMLSARLPYQERDPDAVERLMHRLRF